MRASNTTQAVAGLTALAILSGCTHRVPVAQDLPVDPSTSESALSCGALAQGPAQPWRRLAKQVSSAEMGACGHLQFLTEEQALWLAGPDLGQPAAIARDAAVARFGPAGERLAFVAGPQEARQLHLRTLVDDKTVSTSVPGTPTTLAVLRPDGEATYALLCDDDGLRVHDAATLKVLHAATSANCMTVTTTPRGAAAVYADARTGALRRVRLGDSEAAAIPELDYKSYAEQGARIETDQLALSRDGEVLIHHRHITEPCGDTRCGIEATFTLADLGEARVLGTAPTSPNACCGGPGTPQILEAAGHGHALLLAGRARDTWALDAQLELRRLEDSAAVHLFAGGATALLSKPAATSHDLQRVRLADGRVEQKLGAAEDVVVSRNEAIVVGSRFAPSRCVHYPDRPGVCHKQIWQLVAWRSDGERVLGESTQPLHPGWVGDDGTMLVEGRLAEQPLPEAADPATFVEPAWGVHLLDASGKRLATLSELGEPRDLWEARDALLIESWGQLDGEWTTSLLVVNPRTGATRRLLHGDKLSIYLDQSRTRLACLVERRDVSPTRRELWAGAVPTP